MSIQEKLSFYGRMSLLCGITFVAFLAGYLLSVTSTFAPSGHWLTYLAQTTSLAGCCVSIVLAAWFWRRSKGHP